MSSIEGMQTENRTVIRKMANRKGVDVLFEGWEETLIWSCLQDVMGEVYAEYDLLSGKAVSAMAMLGDFTFFAGSPSRKLVLYKPAECENDFMIMVPQTEEWAKMIEQSYPENSKRVMRYAIKKEPDVFDKVKLKQFVEELPKEYEIRLMDKALFDKCKEAGWSRDLVSQYGNYEMYEELGLGVVILHKGEPVAGASSYSSYRGGIEIEIDTRDL